MYNNDLTKSNHIDTDNIKVLTLADMPYTIPKDGILSIYADYNSMRRVNVEGIQFVARGISGLSGHGYMAVKKGLVLSDFDVSTGTGNLTYFPYQ